MGPLAFARPRSGKPAAALCFAPLLCAATACGPKQAPVVDPVAPLTASVGVELRIGLHATAPAPVSYAWFASDLPDLATRKLAPTLVSYAEGEALFRWTPLAGDEGRHEVDFIATAAGQATSAAAATEVPALITVTPGPNAPPTFREPIGAGTTLEIARGPCAGIDVIVEDSDSPDVKIALDAPPDNASLDQTGPGAATVQFCPSAQQIADAQVFLLLLTADDGTNPPTEKPYTIVVRPAGGAMCATAAPTLQHTPHGDITTTGNLHLSAMIADDVGIAIARAYYTLTAPRNPARPDLAEFQPLQMPRKSGTARAGTFEAIVPNPVLTQPSGTVATVYYVLEADDADPPDGCEHVTLAPAMGVYSFKVKRP